MMVSVAMCTAVCNIQSAYFHATSQNSTHMFTINNLAYKTSSTRFSYMGGDGQKVTTSKIFSLYCTRAYIQLL